MNIILLLAIYLFLILYEIKLNLKNIPYIYNLSVISRFYLNLHLVNLVI